MKVGNVDWLQSLQLWFMVLTKQGCFVDNESGERRLSPSASSLALEASTLPIFTDLEMCIYKARMLCRQ
jgi:type III secretory pathway component EscT